MQTTNSQSARALAVEPMAPSSKMGACVRPDPSRTRRNIVRLHTGVRGSVTSRLWWGSSASDSKRPRVAILDPDRQLPEWCDLVCVENDPRWDRLHPAARIDHPELFNAAPARVPGCLTLPHR